MRTVIFCDNSLRELINFREEVIISYAMAGYRVYLLAPENCVYTPSHPNIEYIAVRLSRGGMNPLQDAAYLFALLKLYRRLKPDFIFHYTVKPNIYGSFASRLTGIPSAAMIAGLGYLFNNNGIRERLGRLLYKMAMRIPKRIFVLNEMNRDLVLKEGLARQEQIVFLRGGEGLNLDKFN